MYMEVKMSKNPLWMVTKFEFTRQIKKPSFWLTILLIPAMVIGMFVISMLAGGNKTEPTLDENTKIAITDEAGVLPKENPMVTKSTREEGKQKVVDGETDLYFYIPADFKDGGKVELYHISEGLDLFNMDGQIIKVVLKQALSPKFSDVDVIALTGNFEIQDNKLTKTGEDSNAIGRAIIPGVILVLFFFFVTLFGGRLLMTVVEEKENRISEMILTTVSAKHLIVGKILSMLMLGAIQILALVIPLITAVIIYRDNPMVSQILSSILTYIGAITPTAKDASQFIGPVIIGVVFPPYFMSSFMAAEPNFLVQFLTYFPLSTPTAMMLRSVFGTLSTPELLIGLVEIVILSFFVIRLTIRTFQKNAISFELVKPKFLKK